MGRSLCPVKRSETGGHLGHGYRPSSHLKRVGGLRPWPGPTVGCQVTQGIRRIGQGRALLATRPKVLFRLSVGTC
jgi:hypothetical protein